ncbi:uncharacterized protein LOC111404240 [Olea europaea var. sylvestris]|uniref:uncharacterized protein LOC111404240 n=1 Tax=Olea europaea var. sylvestris TaxID=158386 RepID=UPI000C1D2F5C|nr:uncharacterized protein LOC111404240 [Olea europaea var. sylvestris]
MLLPSPPRCLKDFWSRVAATVSATSFFSSLTTSTASADFNPGRLQFYRYSEKAQHTLTLLLACSRPEQVHQEPVLSQLLGLLPRFSLPLLLVLKDLEKFLP